MYSYGTFNHLARPNRRPTRRSSERRRPVSKMSERRSTRRGGRERRSFGRRVRDLLGARSPGALAGSPPGGGGRLLQL